MVLEIKINEKYPLSFKIKAATRAYYIKEVFLEKKITYIFLVSYICDKSGKNS
jgi:hypothetical protein